MCDYTVTERNHWFYGFCMLGTLLHWNYCSVRIKNSLLNNFALSNWVFCFCTPRYYRENLTLRVRAAFDVCNIQWRIDRTNRNLFGFNGCLSLYHLSMFRDRMTSIQYQRASHVYLKLAKFHSVMLGCLCTIEKKRPSAFITSPLHLLFSGTPKEIVIAILHNVFWTRPNTASNSLRFYLWIPEIEWDNCIVID